MRTRILRLAVLGLIALLALVVVGGCTEGESDDSPAETEESSTEAESTDGDAAEEDATDASSDGEEEDEMAAFVGTWENTEGGVFTLITFNADGTATVTNYAGMKTEGTWSIEEGYLEVTSTEDENYGAMMIWLTETEWDWAYEDGTWTAVE
jgi:hypothetical protein